MFLRASTGHRPVRPRWVLGAAAAASLALVLTGCSAGGSNSSSTPSDTLVVYTGQAGDYQINFNPYSPSSIGGIGAIYESLFFVTNVNTEAYEPLLGTEYAWNEAGTELAVTLRDDATWSDGEPFTADDVAFTFQMLLDTPSLNTSGFDGTVTATDDTHVVFTWSKPAFVAGPTLLGRTPIVPEHLWSGIDPTTDVMAEPVGTGAFTLDDFKAQAFTLASNPEYWGGEPEVKKVRYLSLSGNTAGADALAAGTIDWQTGPVPDMENVSENYPGYDAVTIPQNQVALLTCSSVELGCEGPQTDPAVRQAIYYALNRDQVNSLAFQNTASEISPTFALTSTQEDLISADVAEPVAPSAPDLDKSGELLEEAGYTKGGDGVYAKDGEPLKLTVEVVTGWTDYITAIDTMGQQLKAAGIELTASQSSWNEWTDKKSKGNYQLAIDSLGQGPASDPFYLYDQYFNTAYTAEVGEAAPTNMARFSDPAVDAALAELKAVDPADTAARQAQFDVIQAAIVEDMPYIPVMTGGTTSEFHSSKFSGWPTMDDLYAFPAIWASPDNAQVFKNLKPTGE
ncbi:ABC transporter substrate-binding protein [Frigoribacterium sp. CFBP9039]|uniref:ABC transporter substrate-binding protein n=1 Tax=Frigoribacterium sp. CFBP9029 TaxID=3096541 RepID=UPI002A69EFC7|nr:ABC transporter substrate-binding protein [Frigoribacterium sp. CFBP9039]MDY0945249.1 ABC transporter substrate-binding protein [Frigoribacterium sp. CFBP9039]